jgi:hypothetical protein
LPFGAPLNDRQWPPFPGLIKRPRRQDRDGSPISAIRAPAAATKTRCGISCASPASRGRKIFAPSRAPISSPGATTLCGAALAAAPSATGWPRSHRCSSISVTRTPSPITGQRRLTPPNRHNRRESALLDFVNGLLGRVLYQRALTITDNNNGFVSVFFLLIPAFTCLLSLGMSPWIKELKYPIGSLFFLGLGLVAAPILVFLWQSQRKPDPSSSQEQKFDHAVPVSDPSEQSVTPNICPKNGRARQFRNEPYQG